MLAKLFISWSIKFDKKKVHYLLSHMQISNKRVNQLGNELNNLTDESFDETNWFNSWSFASYFDLLSSPLNQLFSYVNALWIDQRNNSKQILNALYWNNNQLANLLLNFNWNMILLFFFRYFHRHYHN